MSTRPAWYEGAVLIEAPEDLTAATPGTRSTPGVFDLWNDFAGVGADPMLDYYVGIKVRVPLTAMEIFLATPPRPFVSVGHEAVDDYWFEARWEEGLGDLTISEGSWHPLGAGRLLKVPTLVSESGARLNLALNTPAGAQTDSLEWALSLTRQTSRPLPIGLHESIGPGVALGIGDSEMTQLLHISANVAENGAGVDAQVQMPDVIWVAAGVPYVKLEHLLTISNTDSAAAALAGGERYKSLIYAKSDGTIAQQKSVKTSGTPVDPTVPEGGLAIAMVVREFDALVNNADITNAYLVGAAHFTSSSLTGSIGPYRAVLDNRLAETSTATTVALTDAATNRIWLLPDGALSVTTTAALPESRAMLLWEVVTAAGAVTGSTDRRLFYAHGYRIQRLDVSFDATLAAAQTRHVAYHGNRTAYIVPLNGIGLYVDGSGTAANDTIFDIDMRAPGGAFATIFTSQGTEDRRPRITVAGATLQDTGAKPEVLAVPAYSVFRWVCDQVPDTTTPAATLGTILLAVP